MVSTFEKVFFLGHEFSGVGATRFLEVSHNHDTCLKTSSEADFAAFTAVEKIRYTPFVVSTVPTLCNKQVISHLCPEHGPLVPLLPNSELNSGLSYHQTPNQNSLHIIIIKYLITSRVTRSQKAPVRVVGRHYSNSTKTRPPPGFTELYHRCPPLDNFQLWGYAHQLRHLPSFEITILDYISFFSFARRYPSVLPSHPKWSIPSTLPL